MPYVGIINTWGLTYFHKNKVVIVMFKEYQITTRYNITGTTQIN